MSKQRIFEDVLTQKYNHDDFYQFTLKFFSGMEEIKPYLPQNPSEIFAEHIKNYFVIGKYHDGGKKILILSVNLQKNKSVERARSIQRNFVKNVMGDAEGAVAAFYSDAAPEKWRLSFIKIEYELLKGARQALFVPCRRKRTLYDGATSTVSDF